MISLSRSALIVLLFTLAMTVKLVKKIPKSEVFCLNEDISTIFSIQHDIH